MGEQGTKLTVDEQLIILEYMRQGTIEYIKYLPYFYSNDPNHIKGETAVKLIEALSYSFDENDSNVQQQLYLTLDKILDGVIRVKFEEDKVNFKLKDAIEINQNLLKEFSKINDSNREYHFKDMANRLNYQIKDSAYYEFCLKEISRLYEIYKVHHNLPQEETAIFYNQILNRQYNFYAQQEKNKATEYLTSVLPYTQKTMGGIIRGAKYKKIDMMFSNGEYEALGTTKKNLLDQLANYNDYLNSIKKLRKENVVIDKDQLNRMNELFVTGKLSKESIESILPNTPEEIRRIVLDKYTQVKTQFLNVVTIEKKDLKRVPLGYNYNNYKIGTQKQTNQNILKIIGSLTEEEAQDILVHGEIPDDLKMLLPLINYCDFFDEKAMIGLLRNYPRVLNQMKKDQLIKEETITAAMPQFFNLLQIVETYDGADDIMFAALGKNVIDGITLDRTTSRDPKVYLDTYLGMLRREYCFIPPVSGDYLNYHYETAQDFDRERLLIGKYCNMSCIGPGKEGAKAYYDALTGHNADVLMIKNKETGEFVARSLCFRKGNYVVFAPIHDKEAITYDLYQPNFLSAIADEMLEQSQNANDTLEYVFITPDEDLDEFYPLIEDSYLKDPFPHADIEVMAYLIGNKSPDKEVEIDSTIPMPVVYSTKREAIKDKSEITSEELTRIKALDIYYTENPMEREEKARNFAPVDPTLYSEIYKGEDWYIAMSDGQIVEEIRLPINEENQERELQQVKGEIEKNAMLIESYQEVSASGIGGKK